MKLLFAVLCFLVIHKSGKAKPVLTQQYNTVVFCDWDDCVRSCTSLNQICVYDTCFCGDENKEEVDEVSQTNSDKATIENYNDIVFCYWEKCVNSCNLLNMICAYSSCTCVDEYTNTDDGEVTVTVSTTEADVTVSTTEGDVTGPTTEANATESTTELTEATVVDGAVSQDNVVFCDWNRCYDSCTTLNQFCSSTCTCATNTAVVNDHPFVKTYM